MDRGGSKAGYTQKLKPTKFAVKSLGVSKVKEILTKVKILWKGLDNHGDKSER